MQNSKKMVIGAALAAMVQFGWSGGVNAATQTWDGGGADNNLSTAANWVGDILPVPADSVIFTGLVRNTPSVSSATTYVGLTFDVNAGAFTFGGANSITTTGTGAVGLINNSILTQTFNVPMNFAAGTVNAGGTVATNLTGHLIFNGLVNIGNNTLTNVIFTGASNTTLAGGITGTGTAGTAGNIQKTGTGTVFVNTASAAWAGDVFINGGAIRINNASALGSGGGRIETALTSGGTGLGALELDGLDYTLAKPVTNRFRQGTTINEVMLRNIAGNHTVSNVTTGSGGSQLNWESAAGNLAIGTLNTTANGGARTIRMIGAGNGEVQNWTPNANNAITLIKDGTGTWTMRSSIATNIGTAAFGAVTVNGGNLVLEAGLGEKVVGNSSLPVVPNVTINSGGTLTVKSADGTTGEVGNYSASGTTNTIKAGGTLDASTFTNYSMQAGQTWIIGGTVKAGNLSTFGDNAIYLGDVSTTAFGTATVVGNVTLSNAFSTATGGLNFDLANVNTVGGGVNDLLSVQGNVSVDNSSGPINIRLHPTAGLANGSYRLIDFTGGSTLNANDFTLSGFTPGTTRQSISVGTAAGQVNLVVAGSPGNVVWKGNVSSTWDIGVTGTPNWLNGATADKYYDFDNASFTDAAANKTVDLSTVITPTSITVNSAGDYVFQGGGSLNGPTGITKSGTGKLTISNTGPNTITGPININAGTIEVGDAGLGSGAVTNNGTLIYNVNSDVNPGAIAGTGSLVKRGGASIVLNDASTYSGATTIESGIALASVAGAFGDSTAGTTVNDGATVFFVNPATVYTEAFNITGGGAASGGVLHSGGAVVTTLNGAIVLAGASSIQNDGGSTLLIDNANGISGSGPITKFGSGTLQIVGTGHTWTGGVNVGDGTLLLGGGANLGAIPGQITVAGPNGTLAFGSTLASTYTAAVSGNGIIAAGNTGAATTLTGDLSGFSGTLSTSTFGVASTLVVATATNATTATVASPGSGEGYGILRLERSDALAANPTINVQAQQLLGTGRLELANNITINAGAINLNQRNVAGAVGAPAVLTPDLAGLLTPAVSSAAGNNTLNGATVITTGGSFAGFEAAANATFTIGGTIKPLSTAASARQVVFMGAGTGTVNAVISDDAQLINVYKIGTGTWTLAGNNSYTGVTRVVAGKLVVAPNAQTPVLSDVATAGTDIMGGTLSLQYTSGNGPALVNTVLSTLTAGYGQAPKFSAGKIRSSTLAANRILGWKDTGTSVDVAYTLVGDTNLDLTVNFDDLLSLAQNYSTTATGKVWAQGDLNYDGVVNFDDLLGLAQNYNGSVLQANDMASAMGGNFAADWKLALSVVPEPTSLGLLAGSLMVLRRRRSI